MSQVDRNTAKMTQKAVFGLAGWSGTGKTTLGEQIISWLTARGYNLATIKHAHHKFDADIPGKDSWRHRNAGARQVLVSSDQRSVHFMEHENNAPSLADLLAKLKPCDLVLVEGFKKEAIPKIEIYRPDLDLPPLFAQDPYIVAVVGQSAPPASALPFFDRDDIAAIAHFILNHLAMEVR